MKEAESAPQPEHTLDAPNLLDDYCLNLLDCGSSNVLVIALGTTVYLWDASIGSTSEFVTVDDDKAGDFKRLPSSPCWVIGMEKNHILTSGSIDHRIIDHNLRASFHIVVTYKGHQQEVCSLKWSPSSRQLASGGSDHLLQIWDCLMASSISSTKWLHKLKDHTTAVKALA
ncbi:hypothetical protein Cgig2_006650 [Carnegiea gigantea]|uniref:Uncharacterized protein n=1 Tax=Carnegiea gigantea TaxID=171969 RepID=A0A9Q1GVB1_9CARY|nr:hypothetical protein Cgig2_006650 [Carnegiea gigantea]